jgi:ubiquitin-conjugating enzyme E2 variant
MSGAIIIPRNFKLLEEVCNMCQYSSVPLLHGTVIDTIQLEASEKGTGDMSVSMGLVDPDDVFLTEWNASILGPAGVSSCSISSVVPFCAVVTYPRHSVYLQTVFDSRLYELRVTAGPDYPAVPPVVRFVSRINLSSVGTNGSVDKSLPALANWSRNSTIESVLVGLRNNMLAPQNRRLAQPPEGTTY